MSDPLRCLVTNNPCGTDTRMIGRACQCQVCAAYEQLSAQSAEIARLREALEPFGDLDGEGAEDFGDDTEVIVKFGRTTNYALKLGDLRRARAALETKGWASGRGAVTL